MKGRIVSACAALGPALALALVMAPAAADDDTALAGYVGFVDNTAVDLATGDWDGRYRFDNVYCGTFPVPERAIRRASALFRGNAVSLVMVQYGQPIEIYVVSSTLPDGTTAASEHRDQLKLAQASADALPELFRFDSVESAHGPVIRRQLTNVTRPGTDVDPFPIEMRFLDSPDAVRTFAESRLFARPADRIEVTVLASVPDGASQRELETIRAVTASFADDMTSSVQACSASLPPRLP